HEVGGRHEIPVARVAAIAAERLREGGRGAGVAKFRTNPDAAGAHSNLGRAQRRHARGIEEYRRGVIGSRGGACEGRAQAARALLEQCESGRAGERRYQCEGSGRRNDPAVTVAVLHRAYSVCVDTAEGLVQRHCSMLALASSHSTHTPRGWRKITSFSRNWSSAVATTSRAEIKRAGASPMKPRC